MTKDVRYEEDRDILYISFWVRAWRVFRKEDL